MWSSTMVKYVLSILHIRTNTFIKMVGGNCYYAYPHFTKHKDNEA
jgi:hypothetical protein